MHHLLYLDNSKNAEMYAANITTKTAIHARILPDAFVSIGIHAGAET